MGPAAGCVRARSSSSPLRGGHCPPSAASMSPERGEARLRPVKDGIAPLPRRPMSGGSSPREARSSAPNSRRERRRPTRRNRRPLPPCPLRIHPSANVRAPQPPPAPQQCDAIAHWHVSRMGTTAIGQLCAGHAGNAGNVGVGAAPTKPSEKCVCVCVCVAPCPSSHEPGDRHTQLKRTKSSHAHL